MSYEVVLVDPGNEALLDEALTNSKATSGRLELVVREALSEQTIEAPEAGNLLLRGVMAFGTL